jgi:hypothetical protein
MYTYIELGKKKKDELLEIVGDLEIEGVDETSTRAEIADAIIKFQKEKAEKEKQEKEKAEKLKKEEVKMADIKKPEEKKPTTTTTSKPTVPAKPEAPKKKYGWL